MKIFFKIISMLVFVSFILPHGVSESAAKSWASGSLMGRIYSGAEHMVTGYDHILFLIGVIFFLTRYFDILKFVTIFTIGHSITLISATLLGITANAYLIDAVIAFSVIYKGFENLDGFKKWIPINAPNLILMVFIFGLIHGFGLSTKLQEIALDSEIVLTFSQILSFNVGVELGQVLALAIIFPFLLMIRKTDFFNTVSEVTNWFLVIAGIVLLVYQLDGFFNPGDHHHHDLKEGDMQHHHHNDGHHHTH